VSGDDAQTPAMKRIVSGLLAALCVATAAPAIAAPSLLLPSVTAPLPPSDAVSTARASLIARDPAIAKLTLSHERSSRLPDGRRVVRFAQLHAGIPVIGRGASVVLDASGAPTGLAAARLQRSFPGGSAPAIDGARAADAASALARLPFAPAEARLAWLPSGSQARLVWTFYASASPLPFAPALAIDADTGEILLAGNAVRFDRAATVHTLNPITTPEPSAVVLDGLPQGASVLTSELLSVQNCIDEGTLSTGKYPIHACVMKQLAHADAQGDFPQTFSSDTDQEDAYAEVAMFYHASKAYTFFTNLGMPELEAKPLNLVVNVRMPAGFDSFDFQLMTDLSRPLEPYNNAFFTPDNPFAQIFGFGPPGAGLWFGQGNFADFAYDGDVVYHELGHALVDRTIKLVHYWHLDQQGASASPGALNEALADYFSSALTGDSRVGEYAATNFQHLGSGEIRDLANNHSCPKNLSGQVHADSTLFSGGLWNVRTALSEPQRAELDAAVMTALLASPSGDLGYEELAEMLVAAVSSSTLGQTTADALAAELTSRGVLPRCERIFEYSGQPLYGAEPKMAYAFGAPGTYSVPLKSSTPYVPGLFQVHVAVDADADKLRIQIDEVPISAGQWGDGDPFQPAVLVRFDATPIEFSYAGSIASSNAGAAIAMGAIRSAEVDVPEGATEVYVMVVNQGDLDGYFTNLSVTKKTAPKNTGGSGGKAATGGAAGAAGSGGAPALSEPGDLSPAGGCACRATPEGAPRTLVGLALLGLALLGRRLRSRSRARSGRAD
jgi:MYXO-CTERM domain-containing protein